MFFDHIEKLKQQYTDKYVVVDDQYPELKRFAGWTGVVRTVNMSGRALVEFNKLENIGWYDIDVDFLKIVDEPLEAEEATQPAPAATQPAAAAAAQPDAGKMNVADVLAAARGGTAAKPAAPPAAEKPKMSVEDIMAAARAEKTTPAAAVAATTEPESKAVSTPEPAAAETPAAGALPTNTADIVAWCRARDGA